MTQQEYIDLMVIVNETLPKLVTLLQGIAPEHREKTVKAAMILVEGSAQTVNEQQNEG